MGEQRKDRSSYSVTDFGVSSVEPTDPVVILRYIIRIEIYLISANYY
jgi:hypothetical protein